MYPLNSSQKSRSSKLTPLYSSLWHSKTKVIVANSSSSHVPIPISRGIKRKRVSQEQSKNGEEENQDLCSSWKLENVRYQSSYPMKELVENSISPEKGVISAMVCSDKKPYNRKVPCPYEIRTCTSTISTADSTSVETTASNAREKKRAKRVERNRQSAAASRERRKRYLEQLEKRVSILSADNVRLQLELWQYMKENREQVALEEENQKLREELHFHQILFGLKEREANNLSSLSTDLHSYYPSS
eukprot:jgi/Galph1/1538/GphlegSOOS_G219.1